MYEKHWSVYVPTKGCHHPLVPTPAMPVCSACKGDLDKAEFSGSQLKKNADKRTCSACCAAKAMAETMKEHQLPADAMAEAVAGAAETMAGMMPVMAGEADAAAEAAARIIANEETNCMIVKRAGCKVLTAARKFEEGELVLREPPCIVWTPGRTDEELLPAFLGAEQDVQKAVLEMMEALPNSKEAPMSTLPWLPAEREEAARLQSEHQQARRALAEQMARGYEGSPRLLELAAGLLQAAESAYEIGGRAGEQTSLDPLYTHAASEHCTLGLA